ncbi:hypothetical protein DFH08DRAFT_802686 [Mycena albidolilacea]|uniref:F-box domain-containing protein n=1 Tax=Mycena albidolilacea TaxID=1033008 RepID=A0AAD7AEJ8_9AGAR|nr:hypothetical protein DFH08DRAFT_802686 [Mycena albidolilacea]
MTTISSLPNELLVAIAVAGKEHNEAENWEMHSTTWKAEWTLSHLSRRFSNVIIGAPELWALVEMVSGKGSVEILELLCLERSRAYKISIILRQSSLPHHWAYQIVPHLSRILTTIQSLRIALRTDDALEMLMDSLRDIAAPRLQHLEVVCITEEHNHVGFGAITIFLSGAPRLSFLKIDGFMLQLPALPLLTASLTHLELRTAQYCDPDIDRIAAITAQCPFLARLHLDITFESVAHNRFHIPTLKFLYISISEFEDSDFLPKNLDSFDTPALTELIVGGTHGDQISQLLSLTGLPHSSFPALLSLSFALACTDSCPCETDPDSLPFLTISSPRPSSPYCLISP